MAVKQTTTQATLGQNMNSQIQQLSEQYNKSSKILHELRESVNRQRVRSPLRKNGKHPVQQGIGLATGTPAEEEERTENAGTVETIVNLEHLMEETVKYATSAIDEDASTLFSWPDSSSYRSPSAFGYFQTADKRASIHSWISEAEGCADDSTDIGVAVSTPEPVLTSKTPAPNPHWENTSIKSILREPINTKPEDIQQPVSLAIERIQTALDVGDYDAADWHIEQLRSQPGWESIPSMQMWEIQMLQASVFTEQRRYRDVIDVLEDSPLLARRGRPRTAEAQHALANAYYQTRQYTLANAHCILALSLKSRLQGEENVSYLQTAQLAISIWRAQGESAQTISARYDTMYTPEQADFVRDVDRLQNMKPGNAAFREAVNTLLAKHDRRPSYEGVEDKELGYMQCVYEGSSAIIRDLNDDKYSTFFDLLLTRHLHLPPVQAPGFIFSRALWVAARAGDDAKFRLLLENGAEMSEIEKYNRKSMIDIVVKSGNTRLVALTLQHGRDWNIWKSLPIVKAASAGNEGVVSILLAHGANIKARDKWNDTALFCAAVRNHVRVGELLLDKGADIEAGSSGGRTALLGASARGRSGFVSMLLDRGAGIDATDRHGRTALICAASAGHLRTAELLLDRGAAVDARGERWRTALMEAAISGHTAIVELLLQHGANVDLRDSKFRTAHKWAIKNGHFTIARQLESQPQR